MSTTITRHNATFKNVPGKLSITSTHVAWVPDITGTMDRQQQNLTRVTNMLASKAGAKRISLKLVFKDDLPAGGLMFTFTSATAEADRETVKNQLIPYVTVHRNGPDAGTTGTGTPGTPASGPAAGSSKPSTATAAVVSQVGAAAGVGDGMPNTAKRRKLDGGAIDSPGAGPSTPGTPGAMTPEQQAARKLETKLKMKVLAKNPNLRALHKELVRGAQISEKEFWEGREALLEAERLAQSLKPGRPSRLLDDRFDLDTSRNKSSSSGGGTGVGVKQKETGPMVLNITKELTREIFEEFPVVQDAYARHVPGISESEFWTRYFTSQLWEQHRASVRKATNEEVNKKKDDIFDLYLEDPDWGIEPRKEAEELVGRVIDLAATEQDHGDSDTVRDHTMQAGRERSSLPLIRRFNEHSNKLLRRSGGEKSSLSSSFLPDDANIYDEIDLEDLHGPAQANTIALDVRDADADHGPGRSGTVKGVLPGRSDEDLLRLASAQSSDILTWQLNFSGVSLANPLVTGQFTEKLDMRDLDDKTRKRAEAFNLQRLGQRYAMNTVREMHLAANAENMVYPELPAELLDSMRTCHNAASEFLRQYWSAVLPTPPAALGAGTPSQSESAKAAKAERMAGYLRGMEGKLEAVVQMGASMGVDPGRIRAALAPTFGAVAVGLQKEERRVQALQAKGAAGGNKRAVNGVGRT